jgi:hypothetical protein
MVYKTKVRDVEDPVSESCKLRTILTSKPLTRRCVNDAKRPRACVEAKGGQLEYKPKIRPHCLLLSYKFPELH